MKVGQEQTYCAGFHLPLKHAIQLEIRSCIAKDNDIHRYEDIIFCHALTFIWEICKQNNRPLMEIQCKLCIAEEWI